MINVVHHTGRQSSVFHYLLRQRWIFSNVEAFSSQSKILQHIQRPAAMKRWCTPCLWAILTRFFYRLKHASNPAEPKRWGAFTQSGQRLKFPERRRRRMVFIINHRYVFSCRVHGNGPETSKPKKGMGSQDNAMVRLLTTTCGVRSQQQQLLVA